MNKFQRFVLLKLVLNISLLMSREILILQPGSAIICPHTRQTVSFYQMKEIVISSLINGGSCHIKQVTGISLKLHEDKTNSVQFILLARKNVHGVTDDWRETGELFMFTQSWDSVNNNINSNSNTPHPPLTNYLGISNDNFRELSTWRAIYYLSYERYHFTSSSFPPRNTTFDISICWDKYKCLNTLLIWITRRSLSSLSSAINICQNYLNKCKLCMINWYILKFQHNLFNRREYFYKLNTITRLI